MTYTADDVAEATDYIIFGECTVDEARKLVAELINAAVAKEREACVAIMEGVGDRNYEKSPDVAGALFGVASAIRKRANKEAQ